MHMKKICRDHLEAKFITVDAEKATFFVSKLQIQMLPAIIIFENGIMVDQIVGFEELGGQDDFPTMLLIRRLARDGGIRLNKDEKPKTSVKRGGQRAGQNNGVDSDDY